MHSKWQNAMVLTLMQRNCAQTRIFSTEERTRYTATQQMKEREKLKIMILPFGYWCFFFIEKIKKNSFKFTLANTVDSCAIRSARMVISNQSLAIFGNGFTWTVHQALFPRMFGSIWKFVSFKNDQMFLEHQNTEIVAQILYSDDF